MTEFDPQHELNLLYATAVAKGIDNATSYLVQVQTIISSPNVQPLSASGSFELNAAINEFYEKARDVFAKEIFANELNGEFPDDLFGPDAL